MNTEFTSSQLSKLFFQVFAAVGEEAVELVVGLVVMIMVERHYGTAGLGFFAFFLALMFALRFITTSGVARYVEIQTAATQDNRKRQAIIAEGFQAIAMTSVTGAILLLIVVFSGAVHVVDNEYYTDGVLLGIIVAVANLNGLKYAVLNGSGEHRVVALRRMERHGIVLAAMWFFTSLHLPITFLFGAYLLGEGFSAHRLRSWLRFPGLRQILGHPAGVPATLQKGRTHLFSDHGLDLLLNIDLCILGFFVDGWKLGSYAEAAILVRFCLIITLALRPILRRYYTLLAQERQIGKLIKRMESHSALLFSLQGILALISLLYYPEILDYFFELSGTAKLSFEIFLFFVPGLLFFNTFYALEPVFEAIGQPSTVTQMTVGTACTNLVLTAFLVPAVGVHGAAIATMFTMLTHFLLFHFWLPFRTDPGRMAFVSALLGLYLVYLLFARIITVPYLGFWLAPLLLLLVFYGCGLFGLTDESDYEQQSGKQS